MSTSKLQSETGRLLDIYSSHLTVRENHRPPWLNGLELDFFIEELSIGIEIQGRQHYVYVPHFHGSYDGFIDQCQRDDAKVLLCANHGVELVFVTTKEEVLDITERIASTHAAPPLHPRAATQMLGQASESELHRLMKSRHLRQTINRMRQLIQMLATCNVKAEVNIHKGIIRRERAIRNSLERRGCNEATIQRFLAWIDNTTTG